VRRRRPSRSRGRPDADHILPTEINIQRHKCEPAHIGFLQNGLVIDDQRSSIMLTLVSYGFFLAAVSLTGLAVLSTLFFG